MSKTSLDEIQLSLLIYGHKPFNNTLY